MDILEVYLKKLENSIIHEATGFIPLFTQSIEKAVNQFTQIQIMYEAINSAILLVTLLTAEPSLGVFLFEFLISSDFNLL